METPRRLERKALIYHIPVANRETGEIVGHLGNVTSEGMMLICQKALEPKGALPLPLEMSVPAGLNENKRIAFDARVVWCRPDVHPGLHCAGFHIERISETDQALIEATMRNFASRQWPEPGQTAE